MNYPDDTDYREDTIVEVKKEDSVYVVTMSDRSVFAIKKLYNVIPYVGNTIRFYPQRFGMPIWGVYIEGRKVFYRTQEEQNLKHQRELKESDIKKIAAYEKDHLLFDTRIKKLPVEFQDRIKRFKKNSQEFCWQHLAYELFTCEQAVLFAEKLKTEEVLSEFSEAPYEKQKQIIPEMLDGHSGNTFGCAVYLAKVYLKYPGRIDREHGAMCPLVGCEEYGCYSTEVKE